MKRPLSTFKPILFTPIVLKQDSGGEIPVLSGEATGVGSQGLLDAYTPGFTMEGLGAAGGVVDASFISFSIKATESNAGALDASFPDLDGSGANLFDSLDTGMISFEIDAYCGRQISEDFPSVLITASGNQENVGGVSDSFPRVGHNIVAGGAIDGTIPQAKCDASGDTGRIGICDSGEIPGISLSAVTSAGVGAALPEISVEASGVNGPVGGCSEYFSSIDVNASGAQDNAGALDKRFAKVSVSASGAQDFTGTLSVTFSKITPTATGINGNVGGCDKTIPLLTLDSIIYQDAVGSVDETFPDIGIYSSGSLSSKMDDDTLEFSRCL